ncbi:MAG: nuclear transport factor 2 family protein [Sulfuricella sp.]|nr:nuclear transport factor 2 family protein [Sulfuricella sp.]
MTDMFEDPVKQQVWATLRALNDAWTQGNPDDLRDYFHQDMVAIAATERRRLEGREACVAGWKGFVQAAKIHTWRELAPDIRLHGNTAIVTYYYEISFDMGGSAIETGGRDLFVFVKENGRWWAVADQFSNYPG